ncbi:MAG: SVM family protein [Candidatus Phytoplasma pruni]|nr:SVM family protein [Candidatus Phytoplasma pruni]
MFRLKNQFKIIYLCLITLIGLLFIINNQVMALDNNDNINKIIIYDKSSNLSYFSQAEKNIFYAQKIIYFVEHSKQKYPILINYSIKDTTKWIIQHGDEEDKNIILNIIKLLI